MKKIISLLLSLTMLLSIVSVVDFSAYASELTKGKCGDNVTYLLDTSTGVLTISGKGNMTNYTSSSKKSPFNQNPNIKSVDIKNGVTSIGDCAFGFCSSLASVTISDSVTSIGNSAFKFCLSLASVTIPDSVTSIGSDAFYDCARLISINVEENNINYFSVNGVLFNRNQNELMCYPAGKKDKNYEIPKGVTSIAMLHFLLARV